MTHFRSLFSPFYYRFAVVCLVGIPALFCSCGNLKEKGYDTKAIAEEVENRKIKRVTQAQLDETTNEWGGQITKVAQQELINVLTKALANQPLEKAAAYCQVSQLIKADSVSHWYKAALKRSSLRDINNSSKLTQTERQLLDAYLYNAEKKLPQTPNVQRLGNQQLLYTAPIILDHPLCLRCHGEVGKDVAPADFQKLRTTYNLDSLTNRHSQDLLGIWSITFEKKEMILKLDAKTLEKKQ